MVEVKEYSKKDFSIACAKRLKVELIVSPRASHDSILAAALEQLEIYKQDKFSRSQIVLDRFGRMRTPDVIWLDVATSKKKADKSQYKCNLIWISPKLCLTDRPRGVGGETPAPDGVSHKFNY